MSIAQMHQCDLDKMNDELSCAISVCDCFEVKQRASIPNAPKQDTRRIKEGWVPASEVPSD